MSKVNQICKQLLLVLVTFWFFNFHSHTVYGLSVSSFDTAQLYQMWENEEIYFKYESENSLLFLWNGSLYHYHLKKCFKVNQQIEGAKIIAMEIGCDSRFVEKALVPYEKIENFTKYKQRFLKCLRASDIQCLRPLISKNVKLSHGIDGFNDHRDNLFKDKKRQAWKKADFQKMFEGISNNTKMKDDHASFEAGGYSGEFRKLNGKWLLTTYLIGD